MADVEIAPYGSWKSPITTDLIVSESITLGQIALDGADIYWIEGRPSEGGRQVIVRRAADGKITDVLPPPFNARTRVHEYGGGSFVVSDGTIYFSNFDDQRLYRLLPGSPPEAITPEADMRYADGVIDRERGSLICVREDHSDSEHEAVNMLVSIPLTGPHSAAGERILAFGNDFYSSPRLSPDGSRLAWLTWNHPNMPWDGCELWVGELDPHGEMGYAERVAGGVSESIFQPLWSPDGVLHFVSDRSGWWNLYRWRSGQVEPLCPMEAEFGLPQWVFDMSTYAFVAPQRIVCCYSENGVGKLASLDTAAGKLTPINTPYTSFGGIQAGGERVVFRAASDTEAASIVQLDLGTGKIETLRRSSATTIDSAYISKPQVIEFPTEHGLTAYGFFYAPCNPDFQAPAGELPPLLVMIHGGPTSATSSELNLQKQFWTSRGIAVLDVNYGGSTGYGRAYRERLKGQWGVVDVDDCVNGAKYLVEHGLVDGNRLAIRGGSAGGYTTLCALAFRDTFKAGASYFGVSDVALLARDTHKFESRYMDSMVGPYPEKADLYYQRSAINFIDRFSCPVIFFQGLEDKIVPPSQAEMMFEALRKKGVPVAYVPFEGEQHGFRRAENIKRSLEAELYFYSKVFGFPLADKIEPVKIENL
ncbi:MAG TPA: prolyl oligopeptidase family serine peptidase [Ktedonobacteraceae bacterium]|jgi:dipeptidyl aminopeptidase/acylaminoacyl peptidase|nr:prolyl oligopeptidase family serine peptidase [Ktedonobacteraceae bacterium]